MEESMMSRVVRPDDEAVRLGKVLQTARLRKGLTQSQLAKMVGYSQRSISDLEQGHTQIHAVALHRIAKALSIDPIELCASAWPDDTQMFQPDATERQLLLLVKQIPPERRDLARRLLLQLRC
jgi:transcriptional regulator with XRE-family HTH domain